jgi:hypothetical protein
MAVRALSNVWVRILYALWRKHEPYQAATFLAAQQAHRCLVASNAPEVLKEKIAVLKIARHHYWQ